MESENQPPILSDLLVTHTMGDHLHDTTKWCRFLSIVGIVFLSIFLIMVIVAGTSVAPTMAIAIPGMGEVSNNLLILLAIVLIAVFGVLVFFLLRFSIYTRRGLEMRNQVLFNEGLKALKIYFIVYGVLGLLSVLANAYNLLIAFTA